MYVNTYVKPCLQACIHIYIFDMFTHLFSHMFILMFTHVDKDVDIGLHTCLNSALLYFTNNVLFRTLLDTFVLVSSQKAFAKISAVADGGPTSRVCERLTLRSAPHQHQR